MQKNLKKLLSLEEAIHLLKEGEPVVFPTETVYGLGALLFNEKAIQKVFTIKGRPLDNPLIAHVSSLQQAKELASALPSSFFLLAEHFWPGPLTLVVPKASQVPSIVSAGHPTIAIRMPAHPVARALIDGVGAPLVAPSANLSGRPSPTCLRDVWEDLEGKICGAVEGGECTVGIESTVLSLLSETPVLLRPGQITQHMLEEVLGKKIALPKSSDPILSPGMKYRHYAPRAQIHLVHRIEELKGPFILSPCPIPGKESRFLSAQTLYAELRKADRQGANQIEVFCDETLLNQPALMNRLLRAAGVLV